MRVRLRRTDRVHRTGCGFAVISSATVAGLGERGSSLRGTQMRQPEYYLGRADETRVIADAALDPKARDELIKIAAEYDDLAKLATTQQSEHLAGAVKSVVVAKRPHLN